MLITVIPPLRVHSPRLEASAQPRLRVSLNQGWRLARIPDSALTTADTSIPARYGLFPAVVHTAMRAELSSPGIRWEPATLPSTAHIEPLGVDKPWQGVCIYTRSLDVPPSWRSRHIVLTLNGAMQTSTVWLNGKYVGGRMGGYLPVAVDLTGKLKTGSNTLIVRLDNRDNPLVPPGKPTPNLDFLYWSGLYRDAFLTVTGAIHITDPFLSSTPRGGGVVFSCLSESKSEAVVQVKTEVANASSAPAVVRVRQEMGGITAASPKVTIPAHGKIEVTQKLRIANPRLWSPGDPNLYQLQTSVLAPNEVDQLQTEVGIRRLKFSRTKGLMVNGIPTRLIGTNRHQEYPYLGNALSDRASFRDMKEIKEAGFNCVRLCHYPQDPAVMAACDKLGLFAIVCAPGWQYDSRDPLFQQRVVSDIKEMVRWHRNHPSVLAWEASLNETYPPKDIAKRWYDAAHSEFTAPDMTAVSDYANGFSWDWPYNQWNDADGSRPQNAPGKPGYIREYGDWEFGGATSTSRQPLTAGEDGQLQEAWNFIWAHNRDRSQWPWTMGDGTWVMYDYHRGYDPTTEHSGMADVFRIPRYICRFFQSQYVAKPMVFVANDWSKSPKDGKVVVFSNGDQVKLYLNGRLVGTRHPDDGPDTPYGDYNHGGHPWDGGNARHLVHPPFTFTGIAYKAGVLKAVAYRHGKVIARTSVFTPGQPFQLAIASNLRGLPLQADGADAVFVYVKVEDHKGTSVTTNGISVKLQLSGPGRIIGPSTMKTENGIASFLVQSSSAAGTIRLRAESDGLKSGDLNLESRPQ